MGLTDTTSLLVVKTAKRHRVMVAERLADIGLYVGQDLLLVELARSDGMSQRELAQRLQVEQATVGVAVRRLEAAGFVQRRPSSEDGRVRACFLTERGQEALAVIDKAWRDAETALFASLSSAEHDDLRRLLSALSDSA